MNKMFENYPQHKWYIPDNRPHCPKEHKLEIMCGETSVHTFEVPLDVEHVEGFEVIYKCGLKPVIIKDNYQVEYKATPFESFISCTLYPYETKLFSKTLLDTAVQIKFYMKDNTVSYSEIYKVEVTDAIDLDRTRKEEIHVPPEPTNIVSDVNYAYTVDRTTLKEDVVIEHECEKENKPTVDKTLGGWGYTED